tara:strand:- start:129 stop:1991 length:1863 start_codon:yes stop_codon:yes gene_type:complete
VKKSQLKNIIRKVIREQFDPIANYTGPKELVLCPCTSIDPNIPGVCGSPPVTMDIYPYIYPYWSTGTYTGISPGVGTILCLGGLQPDPSPSSNSNIGPQGGTCDPQNVYVVMQNNGTSAGFVPGTLLAGAVVAQYIHPSHPNHCSIWTTLFQNSHRKITIEVCDCQGTTPAIMGPQGCGGSFAIGNTITWNANANHGWQCNSQICTQADLQQTFTYTQPGGMLNGMTLTYTLQSFNNPVYQAPNIRDMISANCPSGPIYGCTDSTATNFDPNANTDDGSCVYPGSAIYGCKCQIYDHVSGQCPPTAGGGSNYFTTDQETLIGGNPPAPGMTFRPYANTNFVVDSISTPTQPGIANLAVGSPCNPPPGPATYDCYPGQGCQQNWQGQGQYSGGTSAQNLQNCEAACQTTYDCDGPPNYSCSPNSQGQGQYSGGTTAQNLADCQNVCVPPPPITGCMDPNACNFDPNATLYNPSLCDYSCQGCTDPTALNYDPNATMDDGSCIYPSEGCADPNATNYNPNNGGCNGDPNDTSCCLYQAFSDFSTGTGLGDKPPADPCYNFNQLPTYQKIECCKECFHATNVGNTSFAPSTCGGLSYQNCGCCKSVDGLLQERFQKLANIKKK